jgi:hypothetical protein
MRTFVRPALLAGIAVSTAIGIAACGGGTASTSTSSTPAAAPAASTSATATGAAGGRGNPFADPTIAACLKAAGIAVPTFTRPTGSFTGRPSGSFTRPSGSFTRARPTGSFTRPSGAGGFGGFGTNSPDFQKIEQALTACGIALPTTGARGFGGGGGGGAPVASATPSA